MAIFTRLADLPKANINDLIDKAEDPEIMLKQIVVDMEQQFAEATQSLGKIMAGERNASALHQKAQADSALWAERSKAALAAGNQDLAKQAVEQKLAADAEVAQYGKMRDEMAAEVTKSRRQVDLLRQKLDEARLRQTMLSSRAQVAQMRKNTAQALGGADSENAFLKMDKMERKILEDEAVADAMNEISGMDAAQSDPFAALEREGAVATELARMMAELKCQEKGETQS